MKVRFDPKIFWGEDFLEGRSFLSAWYTKTERNTIQNPIIILIKTYGTIAIRMIAETERITESLLFLFLVLDLINTYIPVNNEPKANTIPMSNSILNNSYPRASNISGVKHITKPNGVSHVV
jgi:hypothetical protein